MNELISAGDNKIDAIPENISKTETSSSTSGWWFWKRSSTTTQTTQVKNPDRDAQKQYFESIIKVREARLKEQEQKEGNKESFKATLEAELAKYNAEQIAIKNQLEIASIISDCKFKILIIIIFLG